MKAYAGLIQDVADTDQAGADLGRQADALGLPAGQSRSRAGQGQVVQADIIEETDAGPDLLEHLFSDELLGLCQLQILQKILQLFDRHAGQIIYIQIAHCDGQGFLFQAAAAAGLAGRDLHKGLILRAHGLGGCLAIAAAGVFQDSFENNRIDALAALSFIVDIHTFVRAEHEHLPDLFGEFPPGRRHIKAVLLAERGQDGVGKASLVHTGLPAQDGDGPLADGKAVVRHQQTGIKLHAVAQSGAVGAGAERIIKGKTAGLDLGDADPAVGAGKALAELQEFSADDVRLHQSLGEGQGVFHGVRHAALGAGTDDQTVHHDLYIVLDIFVQGDVLGDIVHVSVDPKADIAGSSGPVNDLLMASLAAADDRGQDLDSRPLGQFHHAVHHLVYGLLCNLPAAVGAVRDTDPGVKQSEIVVDLCHRAHGGTGVAVGGFLIDGDRGRKSLDVFHIRLLHLAQELAGIGRERLHVAALSLCVDRVKGKRGLARTGQTGQDDQLVAGDGHIDPLEIMFVGAPDLDTVLRIDLLAALCVDLPLCQSLFFIFRKGRPVIGLFHFQYFFLSHIHSFRPCRS